jgi:uncharacterized protein
MTGGERNRLEALGFRSVVDMGWRCRGAFAAGRVYGARWRAPSQRRDGAGSSAAGAGTLSLMSADLEERFTGLPVTEHANGLVVVRAQTHSSRRRGLSRLAALAPAHALHIPQCPAVHTFGMRFGLDLIWLAKDGSVVRIDRDVRPRRMRFCRRARSVVETAAGQADRFIAAGVGAG